MILLYQDISGCQDISGLSLLTLILYINIL
nr:MAG TPA: hypothetical protein [Caudoviricetes sp.]